MCAIYTLPSRSVRSVRSFSSVHSARSSRLSGFKVIPTTHRDLLWCAHRTAQSLHRSLLQDPPFFFCLLPYPGWSFANWRDRRDRYEKRKHYYFSVPEKHSKYLEGRLPFAEFWVAVWGACFLFVLFFLLIPSPPFTQLDCLILFNSLGRSHMPQPLWWCAQMARSLLQDPAPD